MSPVLSIVSLWVYDAAMALTTTDRRQMQRRCAGLHAEIGARAAQHRHDTDSVQQLIYLRKVEAAMLQALAER